VHTHIRGTENHHRPPTPITHPLTPLTQPPTPITTILTQPPTPLTQGCLLLQTPRSGMLLQPRTPQPQCCHPTARKRGGRAAQCTGPVPTRGTLQSAAGFRPLEHQSTTRMQLAAKPTHSLPPSSISLPIDPASQQPCSTTNIHPTKPGPTTHPCALPGEHASCVQTYAWMTQHTLTNKK
jgi:hypothetical protein